MFQSTSNYEEALQKTKDELAAGNDSTHFSGFYDIGMIEKASVGLSILNNLSKVKDENATIIKETLDQKKSEGSIDFTTYMLLRLIIPRMIEFQILENVKITASAILHWCKNRYIIKICEQPNETQLVLIFPTSSGDISFRPIEDAIGTHSLTVSYALMLFGFKEVISIIEDNVKIGQHFLILIFSLDNLKEKLQKL